jgi:lipoate-protein ligase A
VEALRFLKTPPATVAAEIAYDRALMSAVACGAAPATLRFYHCRDEAVVVGIAQRAEDHVDSAACAADGVSVLQRFSGGGTVLICRGCLVYSLIMPHSTALKPFDVNGAYRYALTPVVDALRRRGIPATFEAPCDVAVASRKIAGNAQAQKRGVVLVHGCFLVDADVERIARYLPEPRVAPAYRAGRPHRQFLCNTTTLGIGMKALRHLLRSAWCNAVSTA